MCPTPQRVPFAQKFPEADPLAIDLLERLLQFDPNRRLTVHEALKHPWLAQLHDEAAEPGADGARAGSWLWEGDRECVEGMMGTPLASGRVSACCCVRRVPGPDAFGRGARTGRLPRSWALTCAPPHPWVPFVRSAVCARL